MTLDDMLFLALIKENPQHVLDMATGTDIWAMHFGMAFYSGSSEVSNFGQQASTPLPLSLTAI
jgi:ubiquinone/menaquinone biosynthesis C-methylase UbiE